MPFNEHLAGRVRQVLADKKVSYSEKKMMGGLTFMVDGKMCVGIVKDDLMARIAPELYEESLIKLGCRAMDFTKRPMKGYIFVDAEGTDLEDDLAYWVQLALDFNPRAKSSKKKKKAT